MRTHFVTGATGYLGSYVGTTMLAETDDHLALLVRAADRDAAVRKLWSSWQLHLDADAFREALKRITFVHGDLHAPGLGLDDATRAWLGERVSTVLHGAASLNRKSEKACLNTNLRGGLGVIQLARWLHETQGLERFGFVSTVAVAGKRQSEVVDEDSAIEWDRSDYDPYARTKKFGEHMVRTLLPDVPVRIFRPSIVMGDSRMPRTTQFDMIFATCMLADLPVLPLPPDSRVDIVNADWAGPAIARLHLADALEHDTFHLSSGVDSVRVRDITDALDRHLGRRTRYAPRLGSAWSLTTRAMHRAPRGTTAAGIGALWKVFWPYVTFDTVFDNERATTALGASPTRFSEYVGPLYDWVKQAGFRHEPIPLPEGIA